MTVKEIEERMQVIKTQLEEGFDLSLIMEYNMLQMELDKQES